MSFNRQFRNRDKKAALSAIFFLLLVGSLTLFNARSRGGERSIDSTRGCERIWNEKMKYVTESYQKPYIPVVKSRDKAYNRTYYDEFEPVYSCHIERRLGRLGDGGKFICGPDDYFRKNGCFVVSIGSKDDVSFEEEVKAKMDCEIHIFDPTGNVSFTKEQATRAGAKFHAIGLAGQNLTSWSWKRDNRNYLPLYDMITREDILNGVRHIDILKVDCEECEFDAFELIWGDIIQGRYSVGQVQVELHGLSRSYIKRFFEKAKKAGFIVFHKERNGLGCNGYSCVEFSLINIATAREIFEFVHC